MQAGMWPFSMQIFTYPPLLQYRATSSTLSSADTWVRTSQGHLREGALCSLLGLGWGWFPDCVVWEVRIFTRLHHCSDKEPASLLFPALPQVCAFIGTRHLDTWAFQRFFKVNQLLSGWLPLVPILQGWRVQLCLLSQVSLVPPLDRWQNHVDPSYLLPPS